MADLGFDGKVAIITGAGGGLGRQHALLLAQRGALVVVNDLGGNIDGTGGDASAAQKVVDEIKAAGGEAVADHNSVATPEGGAAIVKTAVDTFGRVDIVVNNAGILRDKSFHNMAPELMNPVFDVHLKGAFHVTQPAWVLMREQGYGRIISTSSAAGPSVARMAIGSLTHGSGVHGPAIRTTASGTSSASRTALRLGPSPGAPGAASARGRKSVARFDVR